MMHVVLVGTGYVGLVSGACFAELGHSVVCVDSDAGKVAGLRRGEMPIYEPGLDSLVAANVEAGRLAFTTDLADAGRGADAVFIAGGTPSRPDDGGADLTYVDAAARQIARALTRYAVVVNKSTVPVGTMRRVAALVRDERPDAGFDVVSNPEFLREGTAIYDFLQPHRVVVGADSDRARDVMRRLYAPLERRGVPVIVTTPESAELTKYAANAFLATKIAFINEVADLCERVGADVRDVSLGIGLDARIGREFLRAGPGYGGSCFPKDTLALLRTGAAAGTPLRIVEAALTANAERKGALAGRVADALGLAPDAPLAGRTVAVLGVAFKPDTDDVRESPSLDLIPALLARGARVRACDPVAASHAAPLLPGVEWAADMYEAAADADALVVMTEWSEFRALDPARLRDAMRRPVVLDLRNACDGEAFATAGFAYHGVGRAPLAGAEAAAEPAMAGPAD